MQKRQIGLMLGVVMLAVGALACSSPLGGAGGEPTPTLYIIPTLSPTQMGTVEAGGSTSDGGTTTTGGTTTGGGIGDALDYESADTSQFSSYRSEFSMTWNGTDGEGNPVEGSYRATQAYSTDPLASYLRWESITSDLTGNESGVVEIFNIGEVTYMNSIDAAGEESCFAMSEEGQTPDQSMAYSPETWMNASDLSNAQRILPDEMVNGVMAQHYRMTETDLTMFGGFSDYEVNVWMSPEGYPIKETMSADGAFIGFGTGTGHMEWTYDLIDVNSPVDITPPDNCEAPAGTDFPKMPDAAEVGSFGTILTYTTTSSIADVVAFYNEQLPALGWTAGEASTDIPGMTTLSFSNAEQKVSILITEDGSGKTSVMVTFEPVGE